MIFHEKAEGWGSGKEQLWANRGVRQPPCLNGGSPPPRQPQVGPIGSPSMSCLSRIRSWGSAGECLVSSHRLLIQQLTYELGLAPVFINHVFGVRWRSFSVNFPHFSLSLCHWPSLERPESLGQPCLRMESYLLPAHFPLLSSLSSFMSVL